MNNYIGEKLETVLNEIKNKGLDFVIHDNNFSVDGDTKLVTNFVIIDNVAHITTGNFIFEKN